jgi:hypothetical protein
MAYAGCAAPLIGLRHSGQWDRLVVPCWLKHSSQTQWPQDRSQGFRCLVSYSPKQMVQDASAMSTRTGCRGGEAANRASGCYGRLLVG